MPNKTDRIVNNLPSTFMTRPRGVTIHAVVNPFGQELQDAENSLAAVMQSHWVDYADLLAPEIKDLALLAALYGLAPRPDEEVEEFREHLKRYVRTYLQGTVTVQGILRVAAEALALHIQDDYADLDTWWTRLDDRVALTEPGGKDAAQLALGLRSAHSTGRSASAARVQGTADLTGGVDLRELKVLRLEADGAGPFEINLAEGAEDSSAVSGEFIAGRINAEVGWEIARYDGRYLSLASGLNGPTSTIEVQDVIGDAAEIVLGLPPRAYSGREPSSAQVRGLVDLSGVLDLSESRYLRLLIDGEHLAEIDVTGPDEAHTLLNQVVERLNEVLGLDVVTTDGHFLTLTSPTSGLGSSIIFQRAAAQQALATLFGPISLTHVGRGPRAAQVVGRRDLSGGVDLSARSLLLLRVDGEVSPLIDVAGEDPADTQLPELVATINERVGAPIASHDSHFITLTSLSTGLASEIVFLTPEDEQAEATETIFGIGPRIFSGHAATPASLEGSADLSEGVNLQARYLLQVRLDEGAPVTVDLRTHADDVRAATPRELADAIDAALGADVGATDGQHLILVSASDGSASSLEILPISEGSEARFVTRALVSDEAAQTVFGFARRTAWGADAARARLVGGVDLQRGVDLRQAHYLRLVIDDNPPAEMDVSGVRPRATLLDEIVARINAALPVEAPNSPVCSHNGKRLVLVSNTAGANSRIRFELPRIPDALPLLLDLEPGLYRGENAEQVRFSGTVDLSASADLSAAGQLRIGLDEADPVDISLTGNAADPHKVTLNEIVIAINLALGRNVATHDGKFVRIDSPTIGAVSRLIFEAPAAGDATQAVFGIPAPREYHGRDATHAQVTGKRNLSAGVDLQVIRFLRIGIDGQPPKDVDCLLASAADPINTTLEEIVAAINDALGAKVASHDDSFLSLTSPSLGEAGRISLEPHSSGDARLLLFGDVPDETTGADPQPAVITGEADLLQPVNLSARWAIRLAVGQDPPVDIDLRGSSPVTTTLNELVDAINREFPDLASASPDDRLALTSLERGASARLELLPLRTIDLIEYPASASRMLERMVVHGDRWPADNRGAAPVYATASLQALCGVSGPALVNEATGWRVRLLVALAAGETARLWVGDGRLQAAITSRSGVERQVPGERILVGPLGSQAFVPLASGWLLSGDKGLGLDTESPPSLQLNDPRSDNILIFARPPGSGGSGRNPCLCAGG